MPLRRAEDGGRGAAGRDEGPGDETDVADCSEYSIHVPNEDFLPIRISLLLNVVGALFLVLTFDVTLKKKKGKKKIEAHYRVLSSLWCVLLESFLRLLLK